jgi:hypothetical protein
MVMSINVYTTIDIIRNYFWSNSFCDYKEGTNDCGNINPGRDNCPTNDPCRYVY